MHSFSLTGATALITGASAGLGVEFARQLATRAKCLILMARREEALLAVRDQLVNEWPQLQVVTCPTDVSTVAGREAIASLIREQQLPVNLLINNAGLGDYGTFDSAEPARIQEQIDVNVTALVQLTHALLPDLKRRGPSAILNVSSLAGTLPLPEMAIYAATKAFVTSFTEALRIELASQGVTVAAVCPGPTPTNFSQTAKRAGGNDTNRDGQGFLRQPNDAVVRQGLQALERGAATVYPGWGVTLAALLFRLLPRWLLRRQLTRRFQKSKTESSAR